MKKIGHFILVTALVFSAMTTTKTATADNVDRTKASEVGAYFLSSQFGDKSITPENLKLVYEIPNTELNVPALYVFNTSQRNGFVIVSGSECVAPVIGYSTDGPFDADNIAPGLQWWLNDQVQYIAAAQNDALEPEAAIRAEWDKLTEQTLPYFGQTAKAIIRLTTSTWNQEPLYNNMCPELNGQRSVTGCVATAMAQILYYWKFPYVGKLSNSYSWEGTTLSADFFDTYYDYDAMVDALDYSSTQEQINAVALLNFHCGVSVNMSYSPESSGAVSSKVPRALRMYFKYEKDSLQEYDRSSTAFFNSNYATSPNAKDSAWVNMLKTEILKRRPLYYAGHSPGNGVHARHAFLCDGYNDATGTLHFNWGWGGSGDCWLNVYKGQLKPGGAFATYNFNSEHSVIIGITPPQDSIHINVGIVEAENPFTTAIYPNPASSQVTVGYSLQGTHDGEMQVYDITGRLVEKVTLPIASTQVTLPVDSYQPGVYICRINGHAAKFVVR